MYESSCFDERICKSAYLANSSGMFSADLFMYFCKNFFPRSTMRKLCICVYVFVYSSQVVSSRIPVKLESRNLFGVTWTTRWPRLLNPNLSWIHSFERNGIETWKKHACVIYPSVFPYARSGYDKNRCSVDDLCEWWVSDCMKMPFCTFFFW